MAVARTIRAVARTTDGKASAAPQASRLPAAVMGITLPSMVAAGAIRRTKLLDRRGKCVTHAAAAVSDPERSRPAGARADARRFLGRTARTAQSVRLGRRRAR